MNHSCQNCRWYNLREAIEDEIGKHECYAYSLICSPICLGCKLESGCEKFESKRNETVEGIEHEWRKRVLLPDESTELLAKGLVKRDLGREEDNER